MHSATLWQSAPRPNYSNNIDLDYPYSETPYLGQYNLVQIPVSLNQLVPHVDYWGEGKIISDLGTSGFINCYNVNHTYQLVSNGFDKHRKIPNRIPVYSYTNCDTRAYIKDNSVVLVTLMGAPINTSCAADIARIVNNDVGSVVVYGFDSFSKDVENLTKELAKKSLIHCPGYKLPANLQLDMFDNHMAFINMTKLKEELSQFVIDGLYDNAVNITKNLPNQYEEIISEFVSKMLYENNSKRAKLMSFAYKLWYNGAADVVRKHFPVAFQLIVNKDFVKIVNKGYNQALKLDVHTDRYGDRLAWGDNSDHTSDRVSWQFLPVWDTNGVTFKIFNVDCNMYLKLDVTSDGIGDREVWGSTNSGEERHRYYVEPYMRGTDLEFHIINYAYHQGLKLAASVDSYGDRVLWGHNGDIYKDEGRFKWIISKWKQY